MNGPFKKSADRTNVFEAAHLHRLPREGLRHRGQRLLLGNLDLAFANAAFAARDEQPVAQGEKEFEVNY